MVNAHPDAWNLTTPLNHNNELLTPKQYFKKYVQAISIQRTRKSLEQGRYLIIVKASNLEAARARIQYFCDDLMPSWASPDYTSIYGGWPRLARGPPLGGAGTIDQARYLTEAMESTTEDQTQKSAWDTPLRKNNSNVQFSFDVQDGDFPPLAEDEQTQTTKNTGNNHSRDSTSHEQSRSLLTDASTWVLMAMGHRHLILPTILR